MQLASTYGVVSFSEPKVLHQVARARKAERAAILKTQLLRHAIAFPFQKTVGWCVARGSQLIRDHVGKRTNQLSLVANALEDNLDAYRADIIYAHKVPSEAFIGDLNQLHEKNVELVILCIENMTRLRDLNRQSRIAASFDKMRIEVERIDAAVVEYLDLGRAARDTRFAQHQLHNLSKQINTKLENYLDADQAFDPELEALADQALERLNNNQK